MSSGANDLKHSVAFRVNEQEWQKLRAEAEKAGTTVPQLAKRLLFSQVGVEYHPKRRVYGQTKH
jgi:hypothetical protein